MNTELNTIGKRIRACRKDMGFSQEKLAEMLYMKKSTVSAYENDVNDISCSVLMEIAKALYVSPQYLLVGDVKDNTWTEQLMMIAKDITDQKLQRLLIEETKCIAAIGRKTN